MLPTPDRVRSTRLTVLSGFDCLSYQLFEVGSNLRHDLDSVVAENLLVIDSYDPTIAVLPSRFHLEADWIVMSARCPSELDVAGWNQSLPKAGIVGNLLEQSAQVWPQWISQQRT